MKPRIVSGELVALAGQITEDGLQWIEVMPVAHKAQNGPFKFSITADDLAIFADSIRKNANRIPVDYDHSGAKEGHGTRAAGWFTGEARVEVTDAGPVLMAEVRWTPKAIEEIKSGEYRFISPEWEMQGKDASGWLTKAKTFLAATLTNRPFFRELAPVGDEQATHDDDVVSTEGADMLKALAKSLGLSEDADEATVMAAFKSVKESADKSDTLASENEALKASKAPDVDLAKLQADALAGTEAKEELRVSKRDTLLSDAVRARKIDPAEKERYTKLYDSAPDETTELIASLKEGKLGAIGSEGDKVDEEGNEGDVRLAAVFTTGDELSGSTIPESVIIQGSAIAVDQDSAKIHIAALEMLEKNGKRLDYDEEEYVAACVAVASKQGIRL